MRRSSILALQSAFSEQNIFQLQLSLNKRLALQEGKHKSILEELDAKPVYFYITDIAISLCVRIEIGVFNIKAESIEHTNPKKGAVVEAALPALVDCFLLEDHTKILFEGHVKVLGGMQLFKKMVLFMQSVGLEWKPLLKKYLEKDASRLMKKLIDARKKSLADVAELKTLNQHDFAISMSEYPYRSEIDKLETKIQSLNSRLTSIKAKMLIASLKK